MPTEIHVVVTPAAVLAGFLSLVAFAAVVFLGGVLAAVWPQRSPAEVVEDAEMGLGCAETVELPRPRGHTHRTGTIHAPQYQRHGADDDTVVIAQEGGRP